MDNTEVEGLEVNSPKVGGGMFESAVGRLWVDVRTQLPIRMEIDGVSGGGKIQTHMVMDDFDWAPDLKPEDFQPIIPSDYMLMGDKKMSDATEETTLDALRSFAELTGGRYPSNLASMTAEPEMRQAWQTKFNRHSRRRRTGPVPQARRGVPLLCRPC